MKKMICLLIILAMMVTCACAEKSLPSPDENGKTTYVGDVGMQFDANGSFVIESLFDEAVLWIEENDNVFDAAISIQKNDYKDKMSIAIIAEVTPNVAKAKDMADSALRTIGNAFSMSGKYNGPSQNSFGTIFDNYQTLICIYPRTGGDYIVMGAVTGSYAHITWAN